MNRLKEIREHKGLTQTQVAEKLGITYQAYAHYEKGRRQPDPEQLRLLADLFRVSIDELLGRQPITEEDIAAGGTDERNSSEYRDGGQLSTTTNIPAVFRQMPDLLTEQRFINTAKIYHELPDEMRERAYGLICGIAIGLGLSIERIIGR